MAIKRLSDNDGFLLESQTSNSPNSDGYFNDGGRKLLAVWGDFDVGTVTLQGSPDLGNTWIDLELSSGSTAQYTTQKVNEIQSYPKGFALRAILTGATSPNVNAKLF